MLQIWLQHYYKKGLILAVILAFCVIGLGAYTRLTHAGLGCPDWPLCYGRLAVPSQQADLKQMARQFSNQTVEPRKAWHEMTHRYIAGILGLLIICILIGGAFWRWPADRPVKMLCALGILLAFQIVLGMWTVTWKLMPIVVMGHLLGGMGLFGLLILLWRTACLSPSLLHMGKDPFKHWCLLGVILVGVQIILGGWVSANYAALACVDFPTCHGQWFPLMHGVAFNPLASFKLNYEGGVLDQASRISIHMAHRYGAFLVACYIIWLCVQLWRRARLAVRRSVVICILILALQLVLGIMNVWLHLPLLNAVLHNLGAACLWAVVLSLYHDCS